MTAELIATIVTVAAVLLLGWLLFVLLPWILDRGGEALPDGAVRAADLLGRIGDDGSLRTDSWELEPSHRAPAEGYTPEQAHKEMQRHRECATDRCAAKHSAFWTLVDAGRVTPDVRTVR
ncbi:hypothetical protein OG563_06030 [Nocardia vinacea]|uniref:HNH endonuclease n=1 Tax=Nocardia vinacea TaxID=96468 RepID=A0ABZ1YXB3_9NOCA|nr:hypothetical protein [Nocardia vinacea]